jgi:threo-3-hydroxy-L-aspartate ammonia-lyase
MITAAALDLDAAVARLRGRVRRTPLLPAASLPGMLFKGEHLQRGGSFKTRGATNAVLGAGPVEELVTGSSGNHGLAVATLGRQLGAPVTVVMARGANQAKATAVRRLGAQVLAADGDVAERDRLARAHAERTGALLVPSADHELVVAGQGTVGLEIFADVPDVGTVFVPTGGGGLLAGVCLAAEAVSWRGRIVGVEPASGRRYARSLAAGHPVRVPPPTTIADGLRGQYPGEIPLRVIRRRVDEMVGVTDDQITCAIEALAESGITAEPSGAVSLAGALAVGFTALSVAIVSGGNTPAELNRKGTTP